MKKNDDIEKIVLKIKTVRQSLQLVDDIIPFLSNVFGFIGQMFPLIMNIRVSLHQSTDKLPMASQNITDVSETTELATHQVMDKLDNIVSKLNAMPRYLASRENTSGGMRLIEDIREEVTDIINALQFQDITSQQLEHTNRILGAVYDNFIELFETINNAGSGNENGQDSLDMIEKELRKKLDMEMEDFKTRTKDNVRNKGISQSEIDKMFK